MIRFHRFGILLFFFLTLAIVISTATLIRMLDYKENDTLKNTPADVETIFKDLSIIKLDENKQINLSVEIASTPTQLKTGLSKRTELKPGTGMYFDLGEREATSFWMKDMLFSIDIIWIDESKIVGFVESAPLPNSLEIPTFNSPSVVTHVLEVPAGFVKENNLKVGDQVRLTQEI